MTRWFRQHQRYMIAGLVILLMASWGVLGTLRMQAGRSGTTNQIAGRTVPQADLMDASRALNMMLNLGLLSPRTLYIMVSGHAPIRATIKMRALSADFAPFVFADQEGGEARVSREAAWRYLVLLYNAQDAGVEVTDGEITELIDSLPQFSDQKGFNEQAYRSLLARSSWTDGDMDRWFMQMCRIAKLINLERESVLVSNAELWMDYVYSFESVRINYVGLDASLFRPLVQVTDEELQAFYEKHRDELAADSPDGIGYKAPKRVRAEYAFVSIDQLSKQVKVTDKEVADYYKAHKEDYRLPEESKPKAGADEKKKPAQPQYKPLKDVSDDIRQKLIATKAKDEAEKKADAIVSDLQDVRDNYENMPQPLEQMARRHGAEFHTVKTASGRDLVSSSQLATLVPDGSEVAKFAFETGSNLYFPRKFDSVSGPIIFQVLEYREPEVQTFDEVKDEVRKDCVQLKAVESAKTFGEKLKEAADKSGLEVAAADMSRHLANLLKSPAGAKPPTLKVEESASFRRISPSVTGIEGGTQKDLINKAFSLAVKKSAVVTTGTPATHVYVIQVSQRTPASADDFAKLVTMLRMRYTSQKQTIEVRSWMDALLASSPEATEPTESKDKG